MEVRFIYINAYCCHTCRSSGGPPLTEKRPQECFLAGHEVETRRNVKKERVQCQKCKFSFYILDERMDRRCRRCQAENPWRKVTFHQEKKSVEVPADLASSVDIDFSSIGEGGKHNLKFGKEAFHARGVEHQRALDFRGDDDGDNYDGFGYAGL
ncbi:unnamed protein product [Amoebophrya sp. A25]|nr:unnamed protein product [Amoebophrya sp. A25]|eukprot:GSA25T00007287001.1